MDSFVITFLFTSPPRGSSVDGGTHLGLTPWDHIAQDTFFPPWKMLCFHFTSENEVQGRDAQRHQREGR